MSFNETPLVVGGAPTTYGELRHYAAETRDTTTADEVQQLAGLKPELLAGALRGMAITILNLVDTIEDLTKAEESKSA